MSRSVPSDCSHEFTLATTDFDTLLGVVARRLSAALGELCSIRLLAEDEQALGATFHFTIAPAAATR